MALHQDVYRKKNRTMSCGRSVCVLSVGGAGGGGEDANRLIENTPLFWISATRTTGKILPLVGEKKKWSSFMKKMTSERHNNTFNQPKKDRCSLHREGVMCKSHTWCTAGCKKNWIIKIDAKRSRSKSAKRILKANYACHLVIKAKASCILKNSRCKKTTTKKEILLI